MKHYVYRIEDKKTGEFYFGSRTCKCNIEEDRYMGSPVIWKPNKENLYKIILKSDFVNREDALLYEKRLVEENIKHPLNRNYSIPTKGFYRTDGNKWDMEWKLQQSERMKQYYQTNKATNLGRKFNEDWRTNISKSRIEQGTGRGSKNPKSYGNVKVVDLNGNEMLFDTAKEAASTLKVDRFTLTQHCKNKTTYKRGKYKNWTFEILD
jgi:hypothetical protein